MADQESLLQSLDKPNQISVGLVETPENRMISYLLDPTKLSDFVCANEPDPDYLPLVGLRTRRVGEQYPYPFLQGYRSGNEVDVVCYMLKQGQPLPPPARVIAYLQSAQSQSICHQEGLLTYCVGRHGSISRFPRHISDWSVDLDNQLAHRALSYKGQEVLTGGGFFVQCDQLPRYGAGFVEFSTFVKVFDAVNAITWESPEGTLNSRSQVGPYQAPVYQLDLQVTALNQNRLRVSYTVTNNSGQNLTNVFCLCYLEFFTDLDSLTNWVGTSPTASYTLGYHPFFYLLPNGSGVNGGRWVGIKVEQQEGLVRGGHYFDSNQFGFDRDYQELKSIGWQIDPQHDQSESYLLFEYPSLAIGESKTMVFDIVIGETFSEISA